MTHLGCPGVVALHHAVKAMREKGISLETCLRGTGDLAAMCDAAYGALRDEPLYNNGQGPNQVDIVCVKARDFEPPLPFRVGLKRRVMKTEGLAPGCHPNPNITVLESIIDKTGDLEICVNPYEEKREAEGQQLADLESRIAESPTISIRKLEADTKLDKSAIGRTLKKHGWVKSEGVWVSKSAFDAPEPAETSE